MRVSSSAYVRELERYLRNEGFNPSRFYDTSILRVFGGDEERLRASLRRWPMKVLGVTAELEEAR